MIPGTKAVFNCHRFGIEKDIVLTHFQNKPIADNQLGDLVIEVNGVFHYARNSE